MRQHRISIIGAGLAGSEAAWQVAQRGVGVSLYEMRPIRMTEAHRTSFFAELVCSNSLGSCSPQTASSLLKEELSLLGAFLLRVARECCVPAGSSLAVDRIKFSETVTRHLSACEDIQIERAEISSIPEVGPVVIASGPLTSPPLADVISVLVGRDSLYFYDAISPIVTADSLNREKMFLANRYDKGTSRDFLNIPLSKEEYERFVELLLHGEVGVPHEFEEERYFESCLPIETLASRGSQTLAFGPMKPVGIKDPQTGKRPFAVIQLRAEDKHATAYNIVGFQTKLKHHEQIRIFRTIPGLERAEFIRLGSIHRNSYINSPRHLLPTLQLRGNPRVFFAGQLTGTEGYLESIATGLMAGINAVRFLRNEPLLCLPRESILGALLNRISDTENIHFQPTNVNMGLLPPLCSGPSDKFLRKSALADRAIKVLRNWAEKHL